MHFSKNLNGSRKEFGLDQVRRICFLKKVTGVQRRAAICEWNWNESLGLTEEDWK